MFTFKKATGRFNVSSVIVKIITTVLCFTLIYLPCMGWAAANAGDAVKSFKLAAKSKAAKEARAGLPFLIGKALQGLIKGADENTEDEIVEGLKSALPNFEALGTSNTSVVFSTAVDETPLIVSINPQHIRSSLNDGKLAYAFIPVTIDGKTILFAYRNKDHIPDPVWKKVRSLFNSVEDFTVENAEHIDLEFYTLPDNALIPTTAQLNKWLEGDESRNALLASLISDLPFAMQSLGPGAEIMARDLGLGLRNGAAKVVGTRNLVDHLIEEGMPAADVAEKADAIMKGLNEAIVDAERKQAISDFSRNVLKAAGANNFPALKGAVQGVSFRFLLLENDGSGRWDKNGLKVREGMSIPAHYFTDDTGQKVLVTSSEYFEGFIKFIEGMGKSPEEAMASAVRELFGHEYDEGVLGMSHTRAVLRESSNVVKTLSYRVMYDLSRLTVAERQRRIDDTDRVMAEMESKINNGLSENEVALAQLHAIKVQLYCVALATPPSAPLAAAAPKDVEKGPAVAAEKQASEMLAGQAIANATVLIGQKGPHGVGEISQWIDKKIRENRTGPADRRQLATLRVALRDISETDYARLDQTMIGNPIFQDLPGRIRCVAIADADQKVLDEYIASHPDELNNGTIYISKKLWERLGCNHWAMAELIARCAQMIKDYPKFRDEPETLMKNAGLIQRSIRSIAGREAPGIETLEDVMKKLGEGEAAGALPAAVKAPKEFELAMKQADFLIDRPYSDEYTNGLLRSDKGIESIFNYVDARMQSTQAGPAMDKLAALRLALSEIRNAKESDYVATDRTAVLDANMNAIILALLPAVRRFAIVDADQESLDKYLEDHGEETGKGTVYISKGLWDRLSGNQFALAQFIAKRAQRINEIRTNAQHNNARAVEDVMRRVAERKGFGMETLAEIVQESAVVIAPPERPPVPEVPVPPVLVSPAPAVAAPVSKSAGIAIEQYNREAGTTMDSMIPLDPVISSQIRYEYFDHLNSLFSERGLQNALMEIPDRMSTDLGKIAARKVASSYKASLADAFLALSPGSPLRLDDADISSLKIAALHGALSKSIEALRGKYFIDWVATRPPLAAPVLSAVEVSMRDAIMRFGHAAPAERHGILIELLNLSLNMKYGKRRIIQFDQFRGLLADLAAPLNVPVNFSSDERHTIRSHFLTLKEPRAGQNAPHVLPPEIPGRAAADSSL